MIRLVATCLGAVLVSSVLGSLSPALAADQAKSEAPPAPIVVDLTVKGSLSEDPLPTGLDGQPIGDNLKSLVDKLAKAKADPAVKGLVIRIRKISGGWAKVHEIRQAIKDFRTSGKKSFAVLEGAGNAEYLIATAADEIVLPESDWLMIKGLAAQVTFYKTLFDKLGIVADWMQVGKYKSYGEPFTRTGMSPAFREEMTELLKDSHSMIAETIAQRQGISVEAAKALIDGGPYSPKAAKAAGLVNRIAYPDELEAEVARSLKLPKLTLETKYGKSTEKVDYSGLAGFMKMMSALSGEKTKKPESKDPKVALIYASGAIMPGKSSGSSLLGEATMGSDTVVKHIRKAEEDPTVKAVVLRVDSPGGSALASDLIWREVVRMKKPIVASMSDVAASGGYYISMGCDKVFAEPGTITGSIGVTGGKIVFKGLMEKVGVTTDTISIGKNGTIMSPFARFSDSEKAAMQRLMDETYQQFVSKAADGRKRKFHEVEKHAGGRVFTGRQAKELGLVDELGTLNDAIASAKQLGGIAPNAKTELLILPEPQGVLETLLGPIEDLEGASSRVWMTAPAEIRSVIGKVGVINKLLQNEPILLMMPYDVSIR